MTDSTMETAMFTIRFDRRRVMTMAALALLGVSVAVEARSGRPVSGKLTISMASAGILLAMIALFRVPMQAGSGS